MKKWTKKMMQRMANEAKERANAWSESQLFFQDTSNQLLSILLDPGASQCIRSTGAISKDLSRGMLLMAHYILHHHTNNPIYGGFVRDTILHGCPAEDLDVGVSRRQDSLPFLDLVVMWATQNGISYIGKHQKGAHVLRGVFEMQGIEFVLEIVDMPHWARMRPLVDCDVNNLKLGKNGLEHCRAG